jgi:hypothetical protein
MVIPKGIPAAMKAMNNGIEEQEQNGVTTPKNTASKYPIQEDFPDKYVLIFSGDS